MNREKTISLSSSSGRRSGRRGIGMILFLCLFSVQSLSAQVLTDTGDVFLRVSTIISNMPGNSGNDYSAPVATDLASWGNVLDNLLLGDYARVADTANVLGYDLVQFLDTTEGGSRTYYILESAGSNYWGTYIYNPDHCRRVVLQAPHPKKDFNTGKEAIHVFRETEALFFCLSGTSRCNHSGFSGCSGTTSICAGSSESYRISDLAHNESTIFQSTTDSLFRRFSDTYFLQLHGFTKQVTDPYVILSNGTQQTPTTDYILPFRNALENEDNVLTFKVAHTDLSWTRLRGFTNTQGRLINSSANICGSNATTTSGRFIHMEQEKTRLRDDETGWDKVAVAVNNTFPCLALPVDLRQFEVRSEDGAIARISWLTASESNNDHFTVERSSDGIEWESIARVESQGNTSQSHTYSAEDRLPLPGKSFYRLKQTDLDGAVSFSMVKRLNMPGPDAEGIELFPNPTTGIVKVRARAESFAGLKIFDLVGKDLGRMVIVRENGPNEREIDLSVLPPGTYLIKTLTSVSKVVKR